MKTRRTRLLLFLSLLSACGQGEASFLNRQRIEDSASGTVALGIGERAYTPVPLSGSGALAGTIAVQSATPDSVVPVTRDADLCGDTAAVTQSSAAGSALSNALVWVIGLDRGKPLPERRREQLTIENCAFAPRVLAVVSGTTINLLSRDPATVTSRFYREGAGTPVEEIHTVDEGQVVPSERIASTPGLVEARSIQQPWMRGYIAVFDHPYFAVTDHEGAFRIDSLAAGTYTVKIWHERLAKPAEQRVVIAPGGTAKLDLSFVLR